MAANDLTFTLGSLLLHGDHDGGSRMSLEAVDGLGTPDSTIMPVQRVQADGAVAGDAFNGPRNITLTGKIFAPTVQAASNLRDLLKTAASLAPTSLVMVDGGQTRTVTVRRSGPVLISYLSGFGNNLGFSVQLIALDPRLVGTAKTGSTGLPMTSGGVTVPFTVPFSIDSTVVAGQVSLTNQGNTPGRVVLRITGGTGGLTAPVVTHVSSGLALVFSSSLTIPEGVYVEVDMDAHTVLENGQASRNGWVTSRGWSKFDPGENLWAFTAASGDGTLTVTAYPSWM